MLQNKNKRILVVAAAGLLVFVILYACATSTQQTAGGPPQPTVIAPPPVQSPPGMEIQNYTGVLETPTGLPEPGPPFASENSSGDTVLKNFPRDAVGNIDFVKAFGAIEKTGPVYKMGKALINPKGSLDLQAKDNPPFPFDIDIPAVGAMPDVVFPHFPHTFWLDCANCHPGLFIMKKGANPISMVKIANGEFCGRCHGKIAFTLSNCTRCHVKPKG